MYSLMLSMNDILKIKIKIIWLLHNIDCRREKKKLLTQPSLRKRKVEANASVLAFQQENGFLLCAGAGGAKP